MRLGIDASNLRGGGGVTHLVELLKAAKPTEYDFNQVIVWSSASTLSRIVERPWLRKIHEPLLDRSLPFRLYWQRVVLDRVAHAEGCDVLFVPGGSYSGKFRPFITMSQNLLPFQWSEAGRYGISWMLLKLFLLRHSQTRTLRRADGTIFLTETARNVAMQTTKQLHGQSVVIPHGVHSQFDCLPRKQYRIDTYSLQKPFRVLYVSVVTVYKHQWHVAEGVATLRRQGLPIRLDLIGPAYPPALKRLQRVMRRLDPGEEFIHYHGPISHTELTEEYERANVFVFASTCEAFGQIVTEAMAAGLPIACSNTGTMRELLNDAALYFDAEHPTQIAASLETLINNPSKRYKMAWAAFERAKAFTWEKCADKTFDFITKIARETSQSNSTV